MKKSSMPVEKNEEDEKWLLPFVAGTNKKLKKTHLRLTLSVIRLIRDVSSAG